MTTTPFEYEIEVTIFCAFHGTVLKGEFSTINNLFIFLLCEDLLASSLYAGFLVISTQLKM